MDPNFFVKAMEGHEAAVLAIDPGETVGWAHFYGSELLACGQIKGLSVPDVFKQVRKLIGEAEAPIVVMENYRVYSWKTQDHAWQSLFTPRLIGAIECLCEDWDHILVLQMAQQAKGFVTDDKLRAWGFYDKGQRHSRDAMRHAIYYLLFEVAKVQQRKAS